MPNVLFLCAGAALPLFWGIAHLFATRSVVRGFGDISTDNRQIITMEWITEGVALVFIGAVVLLSALGDRTSAAAEAVRWASIAVLLILSVVSLFTGFRVRFLPFKLCPVIFSTSAVLILLGILWQR